MTESSQCTTAHYVAELLLKIEAVHFRPHRPFRLASGEPSPVYVDCRRIISFPKERTEVVQLMTEMIARDLLTGGKLNCIAGGETAGIPFAAMVADRLGLPMSYVRKKPKGYGRNAQIEGVVRSGDNVLLVEDMATDGGSKLRFAEAIRKVGASCQYTAVILGYGIFPTKERQLIENGLQLHRLCRLADVYEVAKSTRLLSGSESNAVGDFIAAPEDWRKANRLND